MDSSGGPEEQEPPQPKQLNTARNHSTKMDFSDLSEEKYLRKQISPEANLTRFSFNEQKTMEYMMNRDPMQEFFALTCQSIKLNSPHINTIATIDTNQLYQKATKLNVPFFQWSTWIESYLNKEFMRLVLQKSKRQGVTN